MRKAIISLFASMQGLSIGVAHAQIAAPEALPAGNITKESFCANWQPVDNADGYKVRLFKATSTDAKPDTLIAEQFDKVTEGSLDAPVRIPNNQALDDYTIIDSWRGTATLLATGMIGFEGIPVGYGSGGVIMTPEMDLSQNNGRVVVSLRAKGKNGGTLIIRIQTPWQTRDFTYTFTSDSFETIRLPLYGGKRDARIVFRAPDIEQVFLDDITITRSSKPDAEELVRTEETTQTSHLFSTLSGSEHLAYYYTVTAKKGEAVSPASNRIYVELLREERAPDAPKNGIATGVNPKGFTAHWEAVDGVDGYLVYLLPGKDAPADGKPLTSIETKNIFAEVKYELRDKTTYRYTVKSFVGSPEARKYSTPAPEATFATDFNPAEKTIVFEHFDDSKTRWDDGYRWQYADMDGDGQSWGIWQSSVPMGFASGLVAASPSSYAGYALTPDDVLYSTPIALSGDKQYHLAWKAASTDENNFAEHYSVYIIPYPEKYDKDKSVPAFSETLTKGGSNSVVEHTLDLSDFADKSVRIFFRHHGCSGQFMLCIDDVHIYRGASIEGLFTPLSLTTEISVYPNPATDKLFIVSTNTPSMIRVYNLKGEAMPINMAADKALIIETYPAGTYILSVSAGEKLSTGRFVKQ